jgi:hypothetical protein
MNRSSSIEIGGVTRRGRAAYGADRGPWWRRAVVSPWPLILLFALSLPAVTTRIYASDEVQYFAFLRSAWFDRDLSFDNEYRYFYEHGTAASDGFRATHLESTTETGHRLNYGTVGAALLWAPFYGVADVLVRAGVVAGPPDGFSHPYVAAVCYGSAVYAMASLLLSGAIASLLLDGQGGRRTGARISAVIVFAGTPLVFYAYVAPVFAHACSAFAVALFVFAWLHARRGWRVGPLMALGAAAALMAMVREQDVFFIVGPAIDFTLALLQRPDAADGRTPASRTRLLLNAAAACAAFAIVWLPQAFAYLTLNGRLGPSRLVSRKMVWTSPHALQVLFSPENGLLFWTPLVLLALAGLVLLAVDRALLANRRVAACMLAMVAAQVYISGSVQSWTVAGAFGQRRFVGLTVLLAIGLCAIGARARSTASRTLVALAFATCTWWNIALMVQFGTGLMDRQHLALRANAYNAFVVVPRELPRVLYRYVFDRKSFYAAPPGGARVE